MTTKSEGSENQAKAGKVVIEVERTDDGLHLKLEGIESLRGLKETLGSMCCCMPIHMGFAAPDKPRADTE